MNFTPINTRTTSICSDTQIMLLTNASPRYKSQYRIEQNFVCMEFHLSRTTCHVPHQRKQVGGIFMHRLPTAFLLPLP